MATTYGADVRVKEFELEDGCAFSNMASYGIVPAAVESERQKLVAWKNSNPDRFYRYHKSKLWLENLRAVCGFLDLPFEHTVFVDNTTTGINDILSSFPFKAGDRILTTNLIYGAMHYASESIAAKFDLEVVDFPIRFPLESHRALVDSFEAAFSANDGRVRLVILEAIASYSAARLPLRELVAVARRHKAVVIIDGAHCCGHLSREEVRELYELGDFLVASVHKWMFTARPVGLLCAKPEFVRSIRPTITSWGYSKRSHDLHSLFLALGTKDYTPFFTAEAAIRFRVRMDELQTGGVARYNSELVEKAADHVAALLGTQRLRYCIDESDNKAMHCPFMREILLPNPIQSWIKGQMIHDGKKDSIWIPGTNDSIGQRCTKLMQILYDRHRVVATIVDADTVEHSPVICVRLSAQIFNTMDDYDRLAHALLDVVRLVETNEIDSL